ncbi:hypothetical protein H8356DRAFT_1360507 [Neocallimastix lanati (nom. inval.)]|nr:hypothetical protein H8356DRAFT_1360507 [Neocallimastix sp. JGI-2020a]
MQPGEKQLGEMQLGEMQHFNTTPLVEIQPGEMQFGEMQLSQIINPLCMKYILIDLETKYFTDENDDLCLFSIFSITNIGDDVILDDNCKSKLISTITTNVTYEEMSGMKEIVPLLESDDSIFKHLTENASGAISIKISDNTNYMSEIIQKILKYNIPNVHGKYNRMMFIHLQTILIDCKDEPNNYDLSIIAKTTKGKNIKVYSNWIIIVSDVKPNIYEVFAQIEMV